MTHAVRTDCPVKSPAPRDKHMGAVISALPKMIESFTDADARRMACQH